MLFDDRLDWDGFLADACTVFHLVDPGFHFERAGAVQRAVHYWQQTGENAG